MKNLIENWILEANGKEYNTKIPTSVYNTLLENGDIEDPYYRDNELKYLPLNDMDYVFKTSFEVDNNKKNTELVFEGLDTICKVFLNGSLIGDTDNMHRTWIFDIKGIAKKGKNELTVVCISPTKWIKEKDKEHFIGGVHHAMKGFPHMRKPHCMFGWDWGPRIPDMGIWKEVYIHEYNNKIEDIFIEQFHEEDVFLQVNVQVGVPVEITLTEPNGNKISIENATKTKIENPMLWWPNGLGEQYLYVIEVKTEEETIVKKIGLRTMTVAQNKDEYGESFAHCVNGVEFFAMGADYIPEDNLFPRINEERTRKLLEDCALANFNCIRVWGGGYYPHSFFFDICDELGLVVWQDFMFSCAHYWLTPEFEENITNEIIDNVKRLRHHASLGLWCGNNEMELFEKEMEFDGTLQNQADYIKIFEYIIPNILKKYDPNTFYWPASPSSGGSFENPNNPDVGDVHYWSVWHSSRPFTDYRKYYFRYLSEFGFQAFPEYKTVAAFTKEEDRNVFSPVMEMHQRNDGANGKILQYISQTFLYPSKFDDLLYASQILQGEAIKYGVEHFRRNRGRCMGTVYWQLNDIWPVASWSSIDYFGRWKALHYYAKRFFAPVLLSCHETSENEQRPFIILEPSDFVLDARLAIQNETREKTKGEIKWQLRKNNGDIIKEGNESIEVEPLSVKWLEKMDFTEYNSRTTYFSYSYISNDGKANSKGSVLFTAPKHFSFEEPVFSYEIKGDTIILEANTYAKSVWIYSDDEDFLLEDNFIDINKEKVEIKILEGNPKSLKFKSIYNIR